MLDKIATKLDAFRTLVLIATIVFLFGIAGGLYQTRDRFTSKQASVLETRIQSLESKNGNP